MRRSWVALYFALAPMILFTCGCGGSSDPGPQFDTTASAPPGPTSPPPAAAASMPSSEDSAAAESSEEGTEEGAEEGGEEMADSGGGMGGMMGMPMGGMGAGMPNKGSSSAEYGADYSAMMGGSGMGGGGGGMGLNALSQLRTAEEDPAPDEDADYLTQGKYAFGTGKEKEAVEYAMAHAIANAGDSQASEIFGKTKWLSVTPPIQTVEDKDKKNAKPKTGSRPATIARFAIGIILDAPSSQTDLKPIGSKQSQNAGGSGGMMMGSGGESNNNNNANAKNKERALYDVTGTFGEAIVNAFEERWNSGQYGTVYNEVAPIVPKKPSNNNNRGGMMGMMAMGSSMMEGNSGDMEAMGAAMMGSAMPGGSSGQATTAPKVLPGNLVKPGLYYVGFVSDKQKQAELLKKAELQGADAIFIFEVSATAPNRRGIVENKARVRLVSSKGEPLARSGDLSNIAVEKATLTPKTDDDDEVQKTVDKFFAQVDERFKMTELPAIKPDQAKARVISILSNSEYTKLQKLYEIALYRSLNLLSEEDQTTAYLIVMEGSEGEALAKGSPIDRRLVLDGMLPKYK